MLACRRASSVRHVFFFCCGGCNECPNGLDVSWGVHDLVLHKTWTTTCNGPKGEMLRTASPYLLCVLCNFIWVQASRAVIVTFVRRFTLFFLLCTIRAFLRLYCLTRIIWRPDTILFYAPVQIRLWNAARVDYTRTITIYNCLLTTRIHTHTHIYSNA